jgi:hypothetical protein
VYPDPVFHPDADPYPDPSSVADHEILGWIRIRGSMSLTNGSGSGSCILDPDTAIFIIDLKDVSKKLIF